MKIDPEKFVTDESRSNPMMVAMTYLDCPIKGVCSYIVAGSGQVTDPCVFFKNHGDDTAECLQDH